MPGQNSQLIYAIRELDCQRYNRESTGGSGEWVHFDLLAGFLPDMRL